MSDEELKTDVPETEDDGAIDEFDANLVMAAETVGLDPDDFEKEDDLYRETEALVKKNQASTAGDEVDEKEEALKMAVLEVVLSAKGEEELDPEMVKSMRAIAKGSGENFGKIIERIKSVSTGTKEMRRTIKELVGAVQSLNEQNIRLDLDSWIRDHADAQAYLGKTAIGGLDPNGKFARRRRSLISKARKLVRHHKGSYTDHEMFGKAFKKMHKPGATKETGKKEDKEPTRLARVSGTTTSDLVGSDPSEAALKAEATSVVAKFRRNSR